jgi:hypothetical protein
VVTQSDTAKRAELVALTDGAFKEKPLAVPVLELLNGSAELTPE